MITTGIGIEIWINIISNNLEKIAGKKVFGIDEKISAQGNGNIGI